MTSLGIQASRLVAGALSPVTTERSGDALRARCFTKHASIRHAYLNEAYYQAYQAQSLVICIRVLLLLSQPWPCERSRGRSIKESLTKGAYHVGELHARVNNFAEVCSMW
jgi:hypothetical protein